VNVLKISIQYGKYLVRPRDIYKEVGISRQAYFKYYHKRLLKEGLIRETSKKGIYIINIPTLTPYYPVTTKFRKTVRKLIDFVKKEVSKGMGGFALERDDGIISIYLTNFIFRRKKGGYVYYHVDYPEYEIESALRRQLAKTIKRIIRLEEKPKFKKRILIAFLIDLKKFRKYHKLVENN